MILPGEIKTLFVIGSGPGIGRAVTSIFSLNRYVNIALIARRSGQLASEEEAVKGAVGSGLNVRTYAVDVADSDAFLRVLQQAETELGKPECIFYNAARVLPSGLLSYDVKDIEYDFKVNVSALYVCAQRFMLSLVDQAKADPEAMPALIVTNSLLPKNPDPQLFALSLAKAAQRNLMQSLAMTYASQGVVIGLITVGGPVSPNNANWNPTNIAAKAWDWFSQSKRDPFEVEI